jgi:hypothetical protein
LGGGFQTTIKLDDYFLNKWREGEYTFTDEMPVIMETGKFGFDVWQGEFVKVGTIHLNGGTVGVRLG